MGSKTQLKYFILEARTGNELEHKSVDGESEIIKGYQKGFIVGVDKENTRNYVVPKELCSRSENGTVLINGIDTGLKAKTLRNAEKAFPSHILLIVSVSDSYDSVLSKLNTTSMVFYTKKLYELENAAQKSQISEADYNSLKEEIEDLKNRHVRELLKKQNEHIDEIQKLDEKYKKLLEEEIKKNEDIVDSYKSKIGTLSGELSEEKKRHEESRGSLKAMQDSIRGVLMDKSKQKIEIERQKAELEQQKSEIEELRKQLKEYQDKEREHNERVTQARENFKKNWVGKGRQPSIRGKDKEKMIIKMRESGVKVKDIAAYMGYSKTTIMTILKANGMTKAYKPRI